MGSVCVCVHTDVYEYLCKCGSERILPSSCLRQGLFFFPLHYIFQAHWLHHNIGVLELQTHTIMSGFSLRSKLRSSGKCGKLFIYWATSLASYLRQACLDLVLKLYGYGPLVRMVYHGRNVLETVVTSPRRRYQGPTIPLRAIFQRPKDCSLTHLLKILGLHLFITVTLGT